MNGWKAVRQAGKIVLTKWWLPRPTIKVFYRSPLLCEESTRAFHQLFGKQSYCTIPKIRSFFVTLKLLLWMYFTLYQSILFLAFFLNELLLVPWTERIDFISSKWSLFGGTLRRIHVSFIPSEFKYGLRRETLYLFLIFVALRKRGCYLILHELFMNQIVSLKCLHFSCPPLSNSSELLNGPHWSC